MSKEQPKLNELEIKMNFKNYKLLENNDFEFTGDYLYLISGPNKKGKTTFMDAFIMLMTATVNTPNPITTGKTKSVIEGTIPGPEGMYHCKVEIRHGKSNDFLVIKPDGTKVKKVTDIRKIFEYNATTVSEFISKSYTTKGRREQMKILAELLDEADKNKFNDLRLSTASGGDLFEKRKIIKDAYNSSNSVYESKLPTIIEKEFYEANINISDKVSELDLKLADLEAKPNKATLLKNLQGLIIPRNETLKVKIEAATKTLNEETEEISNLAREVVTINAAIQDYKVRLAEIDIRKDSLAESKASDNLNTLNASQITLNKEYNEAIANFPDDTELKESILKLKADKELLSETSTKVIVTKSKIDETDLLKVEIDKDLVKLNVAEENLEKGREDLKEIITKIKVPGYDISIVDDAIHIDGFVLNEYQTSDSSMTIAVTAILARANRKAKILCVGKLAELDKKSKSKLVEIAKENNMIIVGDEVNDDYDDIYVKGFQEEPIDIDAFNANFAAKKKVLEIINDEESEFKAIPTSEDIGTGGIEGNVEEKSTPAIPEAQNIIPDEKDNENFINELLENNQAFKRGSEL